jgi:hypothetical protein
MMSWYRRIRYSAYGMFPVGLGLIMLAGNASESFSKLQKAGLGLCLGAFVFLTISQMIWVIETIRRRGKPVQETDEDEADS